MVRRELAQPVARRRPTGYGSGGEEPPTRHTAAVATEGMPVAVAVSGTAERLAAQAGGATGAEEQGGVAGEVGAGCRKAGLDAGPEDGVVARDVEVGGQVTEHAVGLEELDGVDEAGDGGDDAAGRAWVSCCHSEVGRGKRERRVCGYVQQAQAEDADEADLLGEAHVQAPDEEGGEGENGDVEEDVGHARHDEYQGEVGSCGAKYPVAPYGIDLQNCRGSDCIAVLSNPLERRFWESCHTCGEEE